jgi:predicted AAA+ superfamily ATPase
MERTIDSTLFTWKNNPDRMVLLVRGARQTGKTYSIRALGKNFPHFLEVNFEEHPEVKLFFDGPLTPRYLCERLSGYFTVPVIPGKTLLFFDEVQQCPNCMKSLRFFHEKMPGLHVVAAGSLLEFAIEELPSFGVGRIVSVFMYPLSFMEFVNATEGATLAEVRYACRGGCLFRATRFF